MLCFAPMPSETPSQRAPRVALALLLVTLYSTLAVARSLTERLRAANLLRVSVALVFAAVVVALVSAVVRTPALRRPRVLGLGFVLAALYALVIWPMDSPEEKLHFVEYGAVGVLAFFSSPARWRERRRFVAAALFTAAAGWVDEGIQALLPSRYYDLRDVGFNALAGVMALSALAALRAVARRAEDG